jgi:ferric-dicitrate binding protein FerR (iron transport regulator)
MYNPELKELLKQYREQKCTGNELTRFWELIKDNNNKESFDDILLDELVFFNADENEYDKVDFQNIYNKIESEIQLDLSPVKTHKTGFLQLLRVASILILFFACGGALSYFVFHAPKEGTFVAYNEIKAPLGARSEVLLPDGSRVWLNAGSTIRYLNDFNKVNRAISLEGEAYFKVAKNNKLPFNVRTDDLNIVAIGTEFNVKSYVDEGIIETTLVEGKISIHQNRQTKSKSTTLIVLEPHQKAVYVKEGQLLTIEDLKAVRHTKPEVLELKRGIIYLAEQVDPVPDISWKDNRLILQGEEFSSLLIKLERKYDVKFNYATDNIKQFRFTGTLENETLTQVLDVIKLSAPVDYELDGKTVRIFENKHMSEKFSGHLKEYK